MDLEAHLRSLEQHGYTVVPAAIPAHLLTPMQQAFERICAAVRQTRPREFWSNETNDADAVDFFRAYELDPSFEPLMDLETVFPILDASFPRNAAVACDKSLGLSPLTDCCFLITGGGAAGAGWAPRGAAAEDVTTQAPLLLAISRSFF